MCEIVTKHGKKRGKERMGINKGSMERQAILALERGISHSQTLGNLQKWITAQALKGNLKMNSCCYIVYNNKLFVFNKEKTKLVTVLNLPTSLQKLAATQIKKQQKNDDI